MAVVLMPLRAQETLTIDITCSPSVVILDATPTGDCLTVHTDLALNDVDVDSPITLNGLEAYLVKADNRGQLVAKFRLSALKEVLSAPSTTLTLTGTTVAGVPFVGSDDVRVIESTGTGTGSVAAKRGRQNGSAQHAQMKRNEK